MNQICYNRDKMPLSKARNRERMRQFRLHKGKIDEPVQPKPYNPMEHRIGDRVLVRQGKRLKEVVIPELDADGNPIPWD